jgi:hypothetical protein
MWWPHSLHVSGVLCQSHDRSGFVCRLASFYQPLHARWNYYKQRVIYKYKPQFCSICCMPGHTSNVCQKLNFGAEDTSASRMIKRASVGLQLTCTVDLTLGHLWVCSLCLYMPIQLTCWFAALFHFDLLIHLYFDKKEKKKELLVRRSRL